MNDPRVKAFIFAIGEEERFKNAIRQAQLDGLKVWTSDDGRRIFDDMDEDGEVQGVLPAKERRMNGGMDPSGQIPVAVFILLCCAFALGCVAGWIACRLFTKPREVILASPRGARGRFVKRPAEFSPPKYPC
jgi:hypothetical protein